jgi:hypothetical protein
MDLDSKMINLAVFKHESTVGNFIYVLITNFVELPF